MSEMIFYTNPMSRGRIVRWMLEEVGAPYETKLIAYGPEMKSADYRSVNPMGKVPALRHNGVVITETPAILAYLADAFPDAQLAPPLGSPARAAYYRALFFTAGPLEQASTNRALGFTPPTDREGMVGYGTYAATLDALEAMIAGREFVAGTQFSAADVYLGAGLGWGMQFGTIDARPAFQAYIGGLFARPAGIRAKAIDDALMPAPAPN